MLFVSPLLIAHRQQNQMGSNLSVPMHISIYFMPIQWKFRLLVNYQAVEYIFIVASWSNVVVFIIVCNFRITC